jgi:hypothetical protein
MAFFQMINCLSRQALSFESFVVDKDSIVVDTCVRHRSIKASTAYGTRSSLIMGYASIYLPSLIEQGRALMRAGRLYIIGLPLEGKTTSVLLEKQVK